MIVIPPIPHVLAKKKIPSRDNREYHSACLEVPFALSCTKHFSFRFWLHCFLFWHHKKQKPTSSLTESSSFSHTIPRVCNNISLWKRHFLKRQGLCHSRSCVCCRAYTNPFLPDFVAQFFLFHPDPCRIYTNKELDPTPWPGNCLYKSQATDSPSRCPTSKNIPTEGNSNRTKTTLNQTKPMSRVPLQARVSSTAVCRTKKLSSKFDIQPQTARGGRRFRLSS